MGHPKGKKNILKERVSPEAEEQAHELAPWVAQDAGDTGEGRLRRRRGLPGNALECGLTGGGTHGAPDEDRRRADRSRAIRGCAWEAGQRPRSAVGKRPSSARSSPAAPRSAPLGPPGLPRATAAGTAVSTPPGSAGGGGRKASPRRPGSQAAAVLARGRRVEPRPRSARRTSPFLPCSRLYATTSRPRLSAATDRHPRSARRPVIPDAPGVREGRPEPAPKPRTPPPRRRSPRLGGPHARPAAAAPLTCIDAMMKPSPQGQRGQRRRGRSRRARVTPRGPNIPGTGVESPMGRGPRFRLAGARAPGGGEGRGGAGRGARLGYLASQPVYTLTNSPGWRDAAPALPAAVHRGHEAVSIRGVLGPFFYLVSFCFPRYRCEIYSLLCFV